MKVEITVAHKALEEENNSSTNQSYRARVGKTIQAQFIRELLCDLRSGPLTQTHSLSSLRYYLFKYFMFSHVFHTGVCNT